MNHVANPLGGKGPDYASLKDQAPFSVQFKYDTDVNKSGTHFLHFFFVFQPADETLMAQLLPQPTDCQSKNRPDAVHGAFVGSAVPAAGTGPGGHPEPTGRSLFYHCKRPLFCYNGYAERYELAVCLIDMCTE